LPLQIQLLGFDGRRFELYRIASKRIFINPFCLILVSCIACFGSK
jgi:hypothetical protein